jgi:hypothetical protein
MNATKHRKADEEGVWSWWKVTCFFLLILQHLLIQIHSFRWTSLNRHDCRRSYPSLHRIIRCTSEGQSNFESKQRYIISRQGLRCFDKLALMGKLENAVEFENSNPKILIRAIHGQYRRGCPMVFANGRGRERAFLLTIASLYSFLRRPQPQY